VYGSETWVLAQIYMNRLGTWEWKILRRLHGLAVAQGIWRTGTDWELRELCKDVDIVAGIKLKSLEWIGHVVGMDQGRTVKKVFGSKPERSGRRGRHRLR
jgi:hypothetical protein